MEGADQSPAVQRMIGVVGAEVSFATGSMLLRELADLDVSAKTVEARSEELGREIASDEREVIEPEPSDADTLYLGLDGTGVPARSTEVKDRQGKQPDGSAKTREAKLALVWEASPDENQRPVRNPDFTSYNAAIETVASRDTDIEPSPFAQRILRETERRGFDKAKRQASSATARRGAGTLPTSTSPTPSRSSTSSTPGNTSSTSQRPSTEPTAKSARIGPENAARNSTRAAAMTSSQP